MLETLSELAVEMIAFYENHNYEQMETAVHKPEYSKHSGYLAVVHRQRFGKY